MWMAGRGRAGTERGLGLPQVRFALAAGAGMTAFTERAALEGGFDVESCAQRAPPTTKRVSRAAARTVSLSAVQVADSLLRSVSASVCYRAVQKLSKARPGGSDISARSRRRRRPAAASLSLLVHLGSCTSCAHQVPRTGRQHHRLEPSPVHRPPAPHPRPPPHRPLAPSTMDPIHNIPRHAFPVLSEPFLVDETYDFVKELGQGELPLSLSSLRGW